MKTADQLVIYLYENGWKPSKRFADTGKWRFLEIKGFVFWGIVCVVEEGPASKDEIKNITSYMRQFLPFLSMGGQDLVILFSLSPLFADLSDCLSKSHSVSIHKIIQFTSDKVHVQNKSAPDLFDSNLGGIILNLAGSREIVSTSGDSKAGGKQTVKIIVGWLIAFIVTMYFIQRTNRHPGDYPIDHRLSTPTVQNK